MFQLAQGVDFRLSGTGGSGKASPRLEMALLYFFQTFRRMYMWEQHGLGAVTLTTIMMVRCHVNACARSTAQQRRLLSTRAQPGECACFTCQAV
jgi:hypothetical protein